MHWDSAPHSLQAGGSNYVTLSILNDRRMKCKSGNPDDQQQQYPMKASNQACMYCNNQA
jgi:hypothetical protein